MNKSQDFFRREEREERRIGPDYKNLDLPFQILNPMKKIIKIQKAQNLYLIAEMN